MSKKNSDKQTYSVDEMMERLRDGDRDKRSEGELVTREDGTQVLRVKKRKRRTQQKKAEAAKRRRRFSLVRTIALVTIPLVLGIAILLLLARYNSSTFETGLSGDIWQKVGGRSKFSRLTVLGTKVKANAVTLSWPDGAKPDLLQAKQVSGKLDLVPFVQGKLGGSELRAESGFFLSSLRGDRKVSAPRGEPLEMPGFERYSASKFSFYFGKKKSAFRLEDSDVRFTSKADSQQLSLDGGTLTAGSWGPLAFKRGTLDFKGDTVDIASLRVEEANRHVILAGSLNFNDPLHRLSVEVAEGNMEGIAGFGLEALLEANLGGATGSLVFRPWSLDSHEFTVACSPSFLTFREFAFLEVFEELYGEPRFKNFDFEVTQGFELVRGSKFTELRHLDLRENGVFALKGTIRVENGSLSGDLKLGLPNYRQFALSGLDGERFFEGKELDDGFFWFDVSLGGTPEKPTDNFRIYFGSSRPTTNTDDLFDNLTR